MQHINDDMDELYRHAAEDYPLKIEGADWESVAQRLNDKDDDGALPVALLRSMQGGSGKKYKYLLLLLLIPAALLIAKYSGHTGEGGSDANSASATAAKSSINTTETPAQPAAASPATTAPAGNAAASKPVTKAPVDNAAATDKPVAGNTTATSQATSGKNGQMAIKQSVTKAVKPAVQNAAKQVPGLADLHAVTQQQDMQQAMDKLHANNNATAPQQPLQPVAENVAKAADAPLTPAATTSVTKESQPANEEDGIAKTKQNDQPVAAATVTTAPDKPDNADGPVTVKKPKRLYVGLYVAPDYTTVKYQPGNKVGFDFGGLLGYKITKSLSIEAGMSVDKKYYTSDGKYYNANYKLQGWLENKGTLLNISGYSNLTSFPLTLKYDFKPGREGNFFVAGGLISYIVHEENYRYQFDKNRIIYTADRSTKISTTNMLANVSISAGYESALGNFCNFRIEPYYRVPVKGIGLGGLPITSMGINIGLTKKIK